MRRKTIVAAVLALPVVNALSLANFQPITSNLIPAICTRSYNSQIPDCTADDFNVQCSKDCKESLRRTASEVSDACEGLIVNSRSLLGIVQNGGIINALCLPDRNDVTSSTTRTTAPIQTTRPPVQTTTTRPPLQTTTTTPIIPIPFPSSTLQTSVQPLPSSTTTQNNVAPTTILPPTAGLGGIGDPVSTSAAPTTTSAAGSGSGSNGDGSGGGSPFDIINDSGSSQLGRSSVISALVLAGWAVMLLGR